LPILNKDEIYKLLKALYGLRESSRSWYECFNNYITKLDFQRCEHDYCLYVKRKNSEVIFVLLFVDDLLICSKAQNLINDVKIKLSNQFKMKDIGKVKNYIGIEIEYDYQNKNKITLSQEAYTESLVKRSN